MCSNAPRSVSAWLGQRRGNVAAVHCKAGKVRVLWPAGALCALTRALWLQGRTGCMIACYLLHAGEVATAEEALALFARERTHDGKGVTIPRHVSDLHRSGRVSHDALGLCV